MAIVFTGTTTPLKPEKFSPASKFIEVVEYDPKEDTMDLTFKTGTRIRYLDVSPNLFISFKQSPTFDSYYSRAIKGNVQGVKLVDAGIGREKSAPLDKIKRERTLDEGLREQQARDKRIDGTVSRAYAAA